MCTQLDNQTITATIVPESKRMEQLPKKFGRQFLRVESAVYMFMEKLSSEYDGGFWNFYTLSNGGFFMAPAMGSMKIEWVENYFEGKMSADAAGLTACLFAFSYVAGLGSERATEMFYKLREYAQHHDEQNLIFKAID